MKLARAVLVHPKSGILVRSHRSLALATTAILALLCSPLVTAVQAELPSHITAGTIGPIDLSALLGETVASARPGLTFRDLAEGATFQGLDFALVPDRTSSADAPTERGLIRAAFAARVPLVVEGSGAALRELCGVLNGIRPDDIGSVRVYGCRLRADGTTSEYYLLQDANAPAPQVTIMQSPTLGSGAQLNESMAADRITLGTPWIPLDGVLDWLAPSRESPLPKASAWTAAWDARWQDASLPSLFICTWDLSVSKLEDNKTGRDFYAVDIRPHTQIVEYASSYSSQVGWYIQNRTSSLDYDVYDSPGFRKSTLVEYQPTGTVSGSTVGWTIGASVGADTGGPTGGLDAQYSKSMNLSDVTMQDQSSLFSVLSKWYETYAGPDYAWWPAMTEPCANAHTTHFSNLAAIVSISSDPALVAPPLTGIRASASLSNKIACDKDFHYVFPIGIGWTQYYYTPTRSGVIDVHHNRAPLITEYNPSNDLVNTQPGIAVNFNVTAYDADGTNAWAEWYLDGVYQTTGGQWMYAPPLVSGGSHLVRVVATDGALSDDQIWTVVVEGATAVGDSPVKVPPSVVMSHNFPNPFNPLTRVEFGIPRPGLVRIDVYDAMGAHVRRLIEGEMAAGMSSVEWNGRDDRGIAVSTGTYFIKLEAVGELRTTKVVLAK